MSEYPILEIAEAWQERFEELGSKPKFWYVDASGTQRLFKEGRSGTGENWAEKIAAELCDGLGLPHAEYDFARCGKIEGVSSVSLVRPPERLVLANEVLTRVQRGYSAQPKFKRTHHTVQLLQIVLKPGSLLLPDGYTPPAGIAHPHELFVGYLLLDAWIGNTDRHDQNWGFIVRPTPGRSTVHLAPTFDHASSLGRSETEARMAERLETADRRFSVAAYATKARSALYENPASTRPLDCIGAFRAFAAKHEGAARIWLDRLDSMDNDRVCRIIDAVPHALMGKTAKHFVERFLQATKSALLGTPENRP